jgi:hypothetical protein
VKKVRFSFLAVVISFSTLILFSSVFAAEKTQSGSSPSISSDSKKSKLFPGSWSSTLDYMYFSFQGTQAARGNIYDFEKVQLDLQLFTLKYSPSPLVNYSLVATYQTNYAETYFEPNTNPTLYKDRTQGISDTLIKRTQMFILPAQQILILEAGLYLPTGSFNERSPYIAGFNYPYNMQLGSGTFDPALTAIYLKTLASKHQFGALGLARIRTGETNKNGYHLGNDWTSGIWYSYLLNSYLTPSLKVNYRSIEGLSGVDPRITRSKYMEFYHNTRSVWDITPTLAAKYPVNKHVALQAMVAVPVWQKFSNIDDVKVKTNWYGQLGITVQ